MLAIIDDDPAVVRAIGRLLRAAGYRVMTYPSGEDFLSSLPKARPDCVVLDLNMPDVSGYDVLAALAREPARIPAIVVTAAQHPHLSAQLKKLGATACLGKPVDEKSLLQQIKVIVRH